MLCDTWSEDKETPHATNFRQLAAKVFDELKDQEISFGFEQEYILLKPEGTYRNDPLAFPKEGYPKSQGSYYCSCGASNAFGRAATEDHLNACIYAGLNIGGVNGEVFPGQWEYQIGICKEMDIGDQMWVSRYILNR